MYTKTDGTVEASVRKINHVLSSKGGRADEAVLSERRQTYP